MKKTIITLIAILFGYFSYSQTGLVENFDDGDITGWSGQADYKLTNVGAELKIGTKKTATWNSFQYAFSPINISANPFVSLKVKTDIDFNLNFSVWDNSTEAHYAYPTNDGYQAIVHSDGYAIYTFDFRNVTGVDLTKITKLNFVFNPAGAQGCNSTVYFDDVRIGEQALVMPAITKIQDQFHGLNAGKVTIPFWGIKDRATGNTSLSVTASSSNTALIPNPTVTYTPGSSSGQMEYTPVTNMSGTAVITVTVSGNAANANVFAFNVTVEPNHAPKIDQVADKNIKNGKQTEIKISGLDDGDANANQTFIITATSSNPELVPNPVVEYLTGDFTGKLKLIPGSGKTGTATIKVKGYNEICGDGEFSEGFDIACSICTGINEKADLTGIQIFPNPSSGRITISFDNNVGITELSVMNLLNKVVFSDKLETMTGKTLNIDLSDLSKGVYFIKLKTDRQEETRKIIIQ